MKIPIVKPERLSGHKLVDYLIANPEAQGTFKWHTLRSCMWVRLLSACPQFAPHGHYNKIYRRDLVKILAAQIQLVQQIDTGKLLPYDWVELLIAHPEWAPFCDLSPLNGACWAAILKKRPYLKQYCSWEKLFGNAWSSLLRVRPEFADRCPWDGFSGGNWINLLERKPEFADRCSWELLERWHWTSLIRHQPRLIVHYTLDLFYDPKHFSELLESNYTSDVSSPGGMFKNFDGDPAAFLVFKTMDRDNARKYLRKCAVQGRWDFLEQLYDLAPEDLAPAARKKQLPFLIVLKAPDSLFRQFFRSVDPELRDEGGNTLLHCALIHDQCSGGNARYQFMLENGCSPEVRNTAGFSCSELIERLKQPSRHTANRKLKATDPLFLESVRKFLRKQFMPENGCSPEVRNTPDPPAAN